LTLGNHLISLLDPEFETLTVTVNDRKDLDAVILRSDADSRKYLLDQLADY
jgi:hypothetical protein